MKKDFFFAGGLVLLPLLFSVSGCSTAPQNDDVIETYFFLRDAIDGDALSAFAHQAIIDAKNAPGYTLAVIKGETVIYNNFEGTVSFTPGVLHNDQFFLNHNTSERYVHNSTFPLASSTKFIVAALIFKMIEDGLINDLNDPVKNYVSEMYYDDVTIYHCLTHSTGLDFEKATTKPEHVSNGRFNPEWLDDVYTSQLPKLFASGTQSQYSASYAILLDLLSRISGKSADQYANEVMFNPCRMEDTYFNWENVDQSRVLMKNDYNKNTGVDHLFFGSTRVDSSGNGGLFSTINDMANFASMMLNDGMFKGTQVLTKETIDKLAEPVPSWGRAIGAFQKHNGGSLFPASAGYHAFGHPGSNGDGIVIDRENNLAYVIMINNGSNTNGYRLLANVFNEIYGLLKE